MPFHVATARQRMQLAVRDAVFELPAGYTAKLPEALAQLTGGGRPRRVRAPPPPRGRGDRRGDDRRGRAAMRSPSANAGPLTVVDHDEY